jgi:phage protein D
MLKREELADPNSCLNRAKDDELIFVLLGRDTAASVALRAWIEERIRLGKNTREDRQIQETEQYIKMLQGE